MPLVPGRVVACHTRCAELHFDYRTTNSMQDANNFSHVRSHHGELVCHCYTVGGAQVLVLHCCHDGVQDICRMRSDVLGPQHPDIAAAHTTAGLALAELGETQRAVQQLHAAKAVLQQSAGSQQQLQLLERAELRVSGGGGR